MGSILAGLLFLLLGAINSIIWYFVGYVNGTLDALTSNRSHRDD